MSFLSRLIGTDKPKQAPPGEPNEAALKGIMDEAKRKNKEAAVMLRNAAERQMQDAEMVRQVIHDMLQRIDKPKPKRVSRKAAR